jgi:hypothetical protein
MLVGYIEEIAADFVHGWAADTEHPDAVVDVAIYVDGKRVAQVPCGDLRRDLQDLGRYGEGRHGFRFTFATPLSVSDRVTARFVHTGGIVPNGERLFADYTPLNAILVSAPGRSGTSLLMGRLSLSPQICIAEMHPFEVRQISYWSTVVATLTRQADFQRSMHPDRLEGDGYSVGSNPFSHPNYAEVFRKRELETEYFQTFVPTQLRDVALKMIEEYYLRVRDDGAKHQASFFAEKGNNLDRKTRTFARALFPDMKEVILIRDPRDLLCSQLSYFRRDVDTAIREIGEATRELLRIKHEESDRITVIKYEDLILNAGPTLGRLVKYLRINQFQVPDDAREMSAFRVHGTSASPEASIGRWRSQLSEDSRSWCISNWSQFLEEFGYD